MAVGFALKKGANDLAIAYYFDGVRWSSTAPVQTRWGAQFDGVACVNGVASLHCTAVGYRFDGNALAWPPQDVGILDFGERYANGDWERSDMPALAGRLQSVSCWSSGCLAVGMTRAGHTTGCSRDPSEREMGERGPTTRGRPSPP